MFYLVCYDIVKDSRRLKVSQLLEGYGMRVQYSVFEVVLNERQYEKLTVKLAKLIDIKEDQVRFYPLSERNRKQVQIIGLQPEMQVDDTAFII